MSQPLALTATLDRPARLVSQEPREPVYALARLDPGEAAQRPRLEIACLLDASASMYQFRLAPEEREHWLAIARQRGDVRQITADGREAIAWSGTTLQELQRKVSTPMLSAVRGLWRGIHALHADDAIAVVAFTERATVVLDDPGGQPLERRLAEAKDALATLGQPLTPAGLEQATHLQEALQVAATRWAGAAPAGSARRLLLVSDGVVADRDACLALAESFPERQIVASVIGVGEEFDEEFLMRLSDLTRGNYHYAATALDLERALAEELAEMTRVVVRNTRFRVELAAGALLRSLHQVTPEVAEFPLMWVESGVREFCLGDLTGATPVELLVELAIAAPTEGANEIARLTLSGETLHDGTPFTATAPVLLHGVTDPVLVQAGDDAVQDAIQRVAVYREERRAQHAIERGEEEVATRHLQAATRMLRRMGAQSLAAEMEAAASEVQAGTRSLSRTKRIKAATRRLGRPRPQ